MVDGNEVKRRLADRAEEVCRYLLPRGKRIRNEWATGNIQDGDGQSLRIHLDGDKAGWWCDFAEDSERGRNLLSLWMAVRGCNFVVAINEAKEFLGIREDTWQRVSGHVSQKKSAAPSSKPKAEKVDLASMYRPLDPDGPVFAYLTEQRGLSQATLERYGVGQNHRGDHVVFPSFTPEGELAALKLMALARGENGKKKMWVEPKGSPVKLLFGIQAIDPLQTDMFITEGEIDALSMCEMGFPAVSVPFGAKSSSDENAKRDPNDDWIEPCYDWLEKFTEIYLCLDDDEPGDRATAAIAPRLGRERCMIVSFPDQAKDANDMLLQDLDDEEIERLIIIEAKNMDPPVLRKPSDYRIDVWNEFYPEGGVEPGVSPPWEIPFRFRPSETTVWHGYTKHGKTVNLQFNLVHIAESSGERSLIASLEIKAKHTLKNMVRQVIGWRKPCSEAVHEAAIDWLDEHFWIYDHVGTASRKELLECFRYAARKYGIKHFVIDSLMRTDCDEEDNDSQKQLLNALLEFASEFEVHVHLVAHDKKPDSRHPENKNFPSKYQVRGSAHVVDLAHNIVCVWRNKDKESSLEFWKEEHALALNWPDDDPKDKKAKEDKLAECDANLTKFKQMHDAIFAVQGQRGGNGRESVKRLYFDVEESWQYMDEMDGERRLFLEDYKHAEIEPSEDDDHAMAAP